MNERAIEIVCGYLPGIDRQNLRASKLNLPRRLAIILSSYYPDKAEMYFDSELFVSIVKVLSAIIPHQNMQFNLDAKGSQTLLSFKELQDYYAQHQPENREPFFSAELFDEQQTTAYLECVDYTPAGGPAPYHDSYTISIYLPAAEEDLYKQKIMEELQRRNITVRKIWTGNERPQITLLNRLKQGLL